MRSSTSLRTSLLLHLALTAHSASASPAPLWNRLQHTLERFTPSSVLQWLPQSPLYQDTDRETSNAEPRKHVTIHRPAATATIHATTTTPLPLPPPWTIYYPEEQEGEEGEANGAAQNTDGNRNGDSDGDSELSKRQCYNSGVGNTGCDNSGNGNSGNGNSGNYNCGNGNSGNYNSGDGQSNNGGSGACGNVVISQSVAYVYPAPSTVVVAVAPVTEVVVVQYPQVYTTYVVYVQPPATTVVYQQPQTIAIAASESYAPRGCAYWEALGYRCSPGNGWRGMRGDAAVGMLVASAFWGAWVAVM
ncbi:hypothetical protein DRE_02608 [Drechslerella stenobrocha 248]|uniref:Uncharacterized protein n=1 Tax=Drechslerella stenobrocha 248 TaxID=1043628 RepID=W7HWV6_9PEZI|nr:hypothetical protein DRE_02608 [Drechslerella stenobrocha 248]